jgi:hypothetical protein
MNLAARLLILPFSAECAVGLVRVTEIRVVGCVFVWDNQGLVTLGLPPLHSQCSCNRCTAISYCTYSHPQSTDQAVERYIPIRTNLHSQVAMYR